MADKKAERDGHPYDPITGAYLDGPHPDDPDNNTDMDEQAEPKKGATPATPASPAQPGKGK